MLVVRSVEAVVLVCIAMLPLRVAAVRSDELESLSSQPIVEGRSVFEAKGCVHCHEVWGATDEPHAGPDLGRAASWRDVMQFAGSLWNHTPAMAERRREQNVPFSTLSTEEMGKLLKYLFYAKFIDEPGDAEKGGALFQERSCARCHQIAGRGGTIAPRLDELGASMSSFFMAQALWNHGPAMAAKMAEMGVTWPHLEGRDVADIVAFVRGAAGVERPFALAYAEAGSPRAGRALFHDKGCVRCHAIDGVGGSVGPDLGQKRAPLHAAEMAAELWNHGPAMWAKMKALAVSVSELSSGEMSDLLAYVYFVRLTAGQGSAEKGRQVFADKGCPKCHAVGGAGASVGPDLTKSVAIRSPLYWTTAMWNHAPAMAEEARHGGVVWPRFADDEMRDLVAFLRPRAERGEVRE